MTKRGFTLTETIIAIFVFSMIVAALFSAVVILYKSQSYNFSQSMAVAEARKGIEEMVKEIREAQTSQSGSFLIEKADDKEFVFYADIDNDGQIERVRYFLGNVNSGQETKECETTVSSGECYVNFSDFLKGVLISAQVKVSLMGDFDHKSNEYAEIFADGNKISSDFCKTDCTHCPATFEGTRIFDVTDFARDGQIIFSAKASSYVGAECGTSSKYSMRARFEFSFSEDISAFVHQFKKGVIEPVFEGNEVKYPLDQEKVSILTSYVRNVPPIFEYFDKNGNKIDNPSLRLKDTTLMKVYLVINIDPNRPPKEFELESFVSLRNMAK